MAGLTNVQNEFLKMQLQNNPEFMAEYFPNVITEGPTGPLYDVNTYLGETAPNVSFDYGTTLPTVPSADMPKGPLHSVDPKLFSGEASTKGEFDEFGKLGSVTQYPEWPKYLDAWMYPTRAAQFTDVNVPYDTKGSRINVKGDIEKSMGAAAIAPWDQYYQGQPITGGQTSAVYMHPEILASYGTAPSSPRNEMVNTPNWYKNFANHYGMEVPETMDQAYINDVIESILTHEVGHGVSGRDEFTGTTEGATSFDFSEFLPPLGGGDYATEYNQEELYNRMKDIEKLKMLSPNDYENHPLWDLYQRRAKLQFARLTGQDEGHLGRLYPANFGSYQKKIEPYVKAYLKKVGNRGISNINIKKEEIGMPQHLTPPSKKTYVAPPSPHGSGDKGTHSTQGRDRGRARGRGETGQIAGGHHFSRGGLIDIPLPGRSRYI